MQHWSQGAVIYHIYALSLARAEFHNDYTAEKHELPEIEKWLGHIKQLGCDTVLLSPVLQARAHGYDVTDYYKIDNRIGTNDEFKAFVRLFHDNGARILMDCVFNHCGRDFFAFRELQSGNMDYAGWFHGVDFSRRSPMGDPFDYATWSGHYELPKFNLQNSAVRGYLLDAARYWIGEFDIDGMRLDAAGDLDIGFMRELRSVTTGIKQDFWLMGEVVHGNYAHWVNAETLHSVTNYILFKSLFSSHNDGNLYELAYALQSAVPDGGLPLNIFVDNHDQPRIASNVKDQRSLATLHTLLFTMPGVPSLYYGSEWGVEGRSGHGSDQPLRPYINIDDPPVSVPWLQEHIRKLAGIRREQEPLMRGGYRQVSLEYKKPFVFERFYEGQRVFTAVNIEDSAESIDLSKQHSGSFADLLSGAHFPAGAAQAIPVAPHSALILKAE